MGSIVQTLIATALAGALLPGPAWAQTDTDKAAVHAAALKFAGGIAWRADTVIAADFTCTGKVQQAILGVLPDEILVAIFTQGLDQKPETLRFDAGERNVVASKIRVDDLSLTADDIAGVSGTAPVGYRPSATCHGVRLSDDTSEAAHIYWDHDHQHFDSWAQ